MAIVFCHLLDHGLPGEEVRAALPHTKDAHRPGQSDRYRRPTVVRQCVCWIDRQLCIAASAWSTVVAGRRRACRGLGHDLEIGKATDTVTVPAAQARSHPLRLRSRPIF